MFLWIYSLRPARLTRYLLALWPVLWENDDGDFISGEGIVCTGGI